MAKLDSQNRLVVPKELIKLTSTNFESELRMYGEGNTFFIDNPTPQNDKKKCFGEVQIHNGGRFFLNKLIREAFNLSVGDTVLIYIFKSKITFEKI